ncbi:NAD(P)/FAD-dependent oxidoreductase [Georgenia sp. SUBG003]|uniref:NAD(P)/FAD-dependent oxidoreductase n=1 Tax=Georgenia sp. SUBG003 TaxID=1497974 RepID=UPI003AB3636C
MTRHPDLVVVGAGIVGAATAFLAARAGLSVTVLDRGAPGGGTSSHGEGNVLVSDKEAGPELDLALYSNEVWRTELGEFGGLWELEPKGGVVVASTGASLDALLRLAEHQRSAGIVAEPVDAAGLTDLEPHLAPDLAGGVLYPQDAQLMPMLAVAHLLRLARELGVRVLPRTPVTGFLRDGDRVTGVRTSSGDLPAGAVLNAAGPWAADVAALAGVHLPVAPRRGFVLVTEPLPPTVRHKVYAAEYVSDVASGDAALQSSPRRRRHPGRHGAHRLHPRARRLRPHRLRPRPRAHGRRGGAPSSPVLAGVTAMRHYHGFPLPTARTTCPSSARTRGRRARGAAGRRLLMGSIVSHRDGERREPRRVSR